MSGSKNSLIAALAHVQRNIKSPKDNKNDFGGYMYRNIEDLLHAAKQVMPDDCCITITDVVEQIGDRFYIKSTATFHCGSESISCESSARETDTKRGMDPSQVTGAASSYAGKYALSRLLAVDNSKDSDTPTIDQLNLRPVLEFVSEQVKRGSVEIAKDIMGRFKATNKGHAGVIWNALDDAIKEEIAPKKEAASGQ